jgi:hypothetical protein
MRWSQSLENDLPFFIYWMIFLVWDFHLNSFFSRILLLLQFRNFLLILKITCKLILFWPMSHLNYIFFNWFLCILCVWESWGFSDCNLQLQTAVSLFKTFFCLHTFFSKNIYCIAANTSHGLQPPVLGSFVWLFCVYDHPVWVLFFCFREWVIGHHALCPVIAVSKKSSIIHNSEILCLPKFFSLPFPSPTNPHLKLTFSI